VIILETTLEGKLYKKKISCVLDTGATITMIPWEIAYALGYNPHLSGEKIGVITASGTE
jgi:predicted aspartyl protease